MSEQQAEQSGHETGSLDAGLAVPNVLRCPDRSVDGVRAGGARRSNLPTSCPTRTRRRGPRGPLSSRRRRPKPGCQRLNRSRSKVSRFKASSSMRPSLTRRQAMRLEADAPKADTHANDSAGQDTPRTGTVRPGRRICRANCRSCRRASAPGRAARIRSRAAIPPRSRTSDVPTRGRRFAAMAAMLLLAVIAGAAGGALATISAVASHRDGGCGRARPSRRWKHRWGASMPTSRR